MGTPLADNFVGPYVERGEGPEGLQAADGGEDRGGEQGQAEAPLRVSASYG